MYKDTYLLLVYLVYDEEYMLADELNKFYSCKSGAWDKAIAFSPKDVSIMLHLPLSSITKYIRDGSLKAFKIGRHYRITRLSLYRFIEEHECIGVL